MASNDYHFITHWCVQGALKEVSDIIGDARELTRWWPSVYLDVRVLEPGDEHGLGKVVSLYTKGWLPYTLRWDFRVTSVQRDGFALVASGDFDGRGIWIFEQDGPWVNITYDWKISAASAHHHFPCTAAPWHDRRRNYHGKSVLPGAEIIIQKFIPAPCGGIMVKNPSAAK